MGGTGARTYESKTKIAGIGMTTDLPSLVQWGSAAVLRDQAPRSIFLSGVSLRGQSHI